MPRGMRLAAVIVLGALAACGDDPSTLGTGRSRTSSSGTSGDTGSSGSSGDPAPTGTTAAEVCVATINEYRKTKGLPAYERWDTAESCSDGQAKSDGSTGTAHGAFPRCGEHAQNECPGWPGPPATMIPQCLKAMFGEGPGGGHYEAMMGKQYTKVSCGFATAPDGQIWAVQNFL